MRRPLDGNAIADRLALFILAGKGRPIRLLWIADLRKLTARAQQHHLALRHSLICVGRVSRDPHNTRETRPGCFVGVSFFRLVDIGQVDIGRLRKAGMDSNANQPAIKSLVHLLADVDKIFGEQLIVGNDSHRPRLLGHKDAAIGRKGEGGRPVELIGHHFQRKAGRQADLSWLRLGMANAAAADKRKEQNDRQDQP